MNKLILTKCEILLNSLNKTEELQILLNNESIPELTYLFDENTPVKMQTDLWYVLNISFCNMDTNVIEFTSKLTTKQAFAGSPYQTFAETYLRDYIEHNLTDTCCLLIAGSRGCTDYNLIYKLIDMIKEKYPATNYAILQGGATGVDTYAIQYGQLHGYEVKTFKPNWEKGKSAGFARNSMLHKIAQGYNKRVCLCIWDGESKGTAHHFKLSEDSKTPLYIYNYIKNEWVSY